MQTKCKNCGVNVDFIQNWSRNGNGRSEVGDPLLGENTIEK